MRLSKADKILGIFRLSDNLVPLFIGVIALTLSIVTSVPGRLEEHSELVSLLISIFLFIPIISIFQILNIPAIDLSVLIEIFLIFPFILFAGYDIYRILFHDRTNPTRLQLSGILSFSIVAITILFVHFSIPAKLYFYTHQDRFQEALAESDYQSIQQIGLIEIQDTIVRNSDEENNSSKDTYFITGQTDAWSDRASYGFVYLAANLENISKNFRLKHTHIHEKWYIFSNIII